MNSYPYLSVPLKQFSDNITSIENPALIPALKIMDMKMAVSAVFMFVIIFVDQINTFQQIDIVQQLAGMQICRDRVCFIKQHCPF